MPQKLNITIDVEKLKNQPVLPEVLQILKPIRPEWQTDSVQVKVSSKCIRNLASDNITCN